MCDCCMKCRYPELPFAAQKAAVSRWPVTSAGWQFANWSCLSETAAAEYNQNSADAAVLVLKAKREAASTTTEFQLKFRAF